MSTDRKQEYREDYLNSEHWASVRARYRASKLPQACVVCGAAKVDLHHRTYDRIGRERLTDLVPLCREHHQEAHAIRASRKKPKATATAKELAYIRRLGGTPPPETTRQQARRMIARLQSERSASRGPPAIA